MNKYNKMYKLLKAGLATLLQIAIFNVTQSFMMVVLRVLIL